MECIAASKYIPLRMDSYTDWITHLIVDFLTNVLASISVTITHSYNQVIHKIIYYLTHISIQGAGLEVKRNRSYFPYENSLIK